VRRDGVAVTVVTRLNVGRVSCLRWAQIASHGRQASLESCTVDLDRRRVIPLASLIRQQSIMMLKALLIFVWAFDETPGW